MDEGSLDVAKEEDKVWLVYAHIVEKQITQYIVRLGERDTNWK